MMSFSLKRFLVISASVSKVDLASTVTFTSYDVPLLLLVRKYPFLIEIVKNCLSSAPADNFKRTFLTPYPSFDKRCALKRTPCSPLCFSLVKRIFLKLIRKTTNAIMQVTTFVAAFPYSGSALYQWIYIRQQMHTTIGIEVVGLFSSAPKAFSQLKNFPNRVMFFLRGLNRNLSLQTKFYSYPRRPLFLGALGKTKALLTPRACLKTMLLQAFTSRFIACSQYLCIAKFSSHLFRTRSGRIGQRRCFLFLRAADCPKMIGENGGTKC